MKLTIAAEFGIYRRGGNILIPGIVGGEGKKAIQAGSLTKAHGGASEEVLLLRFRRPDCPLLICTLIAAEELLPGAGLVTLMP